MRKNYPFPAKTDWSWLWHPSPAKDRASHTKCAFRCRSLGWGKDTSRARPCCAGVIEGAAYWIWMHCFWGCRQQPVSYGHLLSGICTQKGFSTVTNTAHMELDWAFPCSWDMQHLPGASGCANPGKAGCGRNANRLGIRRQMVLGEVRWPPQQCQETFLKWKKSIGCFSTHLSEMSPAWWQLLHADLTGLLLLGSRSAPCSGWQQPVFPDTGLTTGPGTPDSVPALLMGTANQATPGKLPGSWSNPQCSFLYKIVRFS